MYRTDKQFMKDPNTAASRVYVGHLAETVVPDNLEEKFKQYGKVLGMLLNKGFAFIQYENESQAQAAIRAEHGAMFHRRKLIVRQVYEGKGKAGPQQPPGLPPPRSQTTQPPPLMEQPTQMPMNEASQNNAPEQEPSPPDQENMEMNQPDQGNNQMNNNKRGNKRKHWNNRNNDRMQQMDNFRDGPPFYEESNKKYQPPMGGFAPPPLLDAPEKNDCEIIVVSKTLTEYAEYIEQRLKSLGLIVDLLFPNEDVPIGRVLANISSRGCLYAMLIMPQNEENRSLTLNILHGIPQEHRNMPVEDAMVLITRNFDAYMRGEKFETDGPVASLTEKHPEGIQMIFNLLAENRQMTCTQYDRIIKYLQDRRELQRTFEGVESAQTNEAEPNSKEAELQNRIMNILNKPNQTESPKPPAPTTSGPTPLLNDPSVQKALDSLLCGDMFKSISAGV